MISENHMREVLSRVELMFRRRQFATTSADQFEKLPCEGSLLQANQSDLGLVDELREVEMRLREIEDEAVFLRFEREMIECELKARIGNSPGIDGVATWESKIRRNFCLPLFQEQEPDTYRQVLNRFPALDLGVWREREPQLYQEITARHPKLDTTLWMREDKGLYKRMQTTYFSPSIKRRFLLLS